MDDSYLYGALKHRHKIFMGRNRTHYLKSQGEERNAVECYRTDKREREDLETDGGTHSSLICTRGGEIVSFCEDVSRACSVDKVVGAALLSGRDLSNCALVTTGRLSGGMVAKAARARIPVVVSKAAPLSTGVELSKKVGMTLVAFVRNPNLYVYSGGQRIV